MIDITIIPIARTCLTLNFEIFFNKFFILINKAFNTLLYWMISTMILEVFHPTDWINCTDSDDTYNFGLYIPRLIQYPSDLFELREGITVECWRSDKVFENEDLWCSSSFYSDLKRIEKFYDVLMDRENIYIKGGHLLFIKDMEGECGLDLSYYKEVLLEYNM